MDIKKLEKNLWESAFFLRGNMSGERFMHVIIGIFCLKYISDKNVTSDEKTFKIPMESRWNYIEEFSFSPKIGQKINEAFIELENENPILEGIFDKNYDEIGIDQKKIGEVIRIFSSENFSNAKEDFLGRIYEYFLDKFFRDVGEKGGAFYTPLSLIKLLVNFIDPNVKSIYDPACGTGGILVQLSNVTENNSEIIYYGQEYNHITWKLAKINLILNGFSLIDKFDHLVLGKKSADTFSDDQHKNKKFDFIMANPPFNEKKWGQEELLDDPRWKFGIPPKGNANYAWISHIIDKLNDSGKAAIILSNGSLSTSSKYEKEIRINLLKNNKVDAILGMPDRLFYNTGIPGCIWILNNKKVNKNVLFVNASELGKMETKKLRILEEEEIEKIVNTYKNHILGKEIEEIGYSKTTKLSEIEENDYSLVPGRYVGYFEEIIDKEKVKEDIKKASEDLENLFSEFQELLPKVKEAIDKALKFE